MEHLLYLVHQFLAQYPIVAPIIFICIHALMAVLFIPCSPMTLMAGALWGQSYGLIISMIAAIVSSSTTFLLSRSFLRDKIEHLLISRYPKAASLLSRTAKHDWKIIAVAQMNPMIPASTMGYIFGLCDIPFLRYVLLSGFFFLPLQIMFVVSGHSAINLIDSRNKIGYSIATIILMFVVITMSKRIYKKLCQILGINDGR